MGFEASRITQGTLVQHWSFSRFFRSIRSLQDGSQRKVMKDTRQREQRRSYKDLRSAPIHY